MARTYEPIASTTLGTAAASHTFSSIPGTHTDLVIVITGNNTTVGAASNSITLRFNGDTGTSYSLTNLGGNGTAATSSRSSSDNFAYVSQLGQASASIGVAKLQIMSYANTNVYKTVLGESAVASVNVYRYVSLWRSTSAITSIEIATINNWASGATFALYGVKAA